MRTTSRITLLVALGAFGWAAPGRAQEATVSDGAKVYAATCGRCHTPRSSVERSDRDWTVITAHMRVRGNITGREMRAVRAFLQQMNRGTGQEAELAAPAPAATAPAAPVHLTGPVDASLAERGRALVEANACSACHRVGDATAGTLGPSLNNLLTRRSPDYVLQKLANPRFDNANSMMPAFQFTEQQRRAILEYLRSVQR